MFAVWQVYIATPAYGGQVTVDYMTSVIHMVTQLKEATQLMIAVGANSAVPVGVRLRGSCLWWPASFGLRANVI